jgi:hypothetical protein
LERVVHWFMTRLYGKGLSGCGSELDVPEHEYHYRRTVEWMVGCVELNRYGSPQKFCMKFEDFTANLGRPRTL